MNTQTHTKGEATKQHLITVGATLFHQQGYKNTGLTQILTESGVTKGSFYFHFKDKQAFGLAIIDTYIALFKESSTKHLNNSALSPSEKIQAFHTHYLNLFENSDYKGGCLIGNFSQEMSTLNTLYAEKIAHAFDGMTKVVAKVISEGILLGEFQANDDIESLANFFVNSWEGALVRMKSVRSAEPLHNWFLFVQHLLFAKTVN